MKNLTIFSIMLPLLASCQMKPYKGPYPGWALLTPEERSHIEVRHLSPDGKTYTTDGKTYHPVGE